MLGGGPQPRLRQGFRHRIVSASSPLFRLSASWVFSMVSFVMAHSTPPHRLTCLGEAYWWNFLSFLKWNKFFSFHWKIKTFWTGGFWIGFLRTFSGPPWCAQKPQAEITQCQSFVENTESIGMAKGMNIGIPYQVSDLSFSSKTVHRVLWSLSAPSLSQLRSVSIYFVDWSPHLWSICIFTHVKNHCRYNTIVNHSIKVNLRHFFENQTRLGPSARPHVDWWVAPLL